MKRKNLAIGDGDVYKVWIYFLLVLLAWQ